MKKFNVTRLLTVTLPLLGEETEESVCGTYHEDDVRSLLLDATANGWTHLFSGIDDGGIVEHGFKSGPCCTLVYTCTPD